MSESAAPIRQAPAKQLLTGQATPTNVATLVVPARDGRRCALIVQHGATDVYLGDANVTVGTGILLTGTKGASISIPTDAAIYGIVAAGSQLLSYAETYGN